MIKEILKRILILLVGIAIAIFVPYLMGLLVSELTWIALSWREDDIVTLWLNGILIIMGIIGASTLIWIIIKWIVTGKLN